MSRQLAFVATAALLLTVNPAPAQNPAADYPTVTFINTEPYRMQFTNGHLQPVLDAQGQLQPNDATNAFKLLSEPWIYVVNGNGRVTGSFEVLAGPDELKAAIAAAKKS